MKWAESKKQLRGQLPLWRRIWYDVDEFVHKLWWKIK